MSDEERRALVRVGDAAPDFVVEMVTREGSASLNDYRGRTSVLLALFRGLQCSFCRQHIALLGQTREKFRDAGFEVLAVTASSPERVRQYLKFRPMKVALAADPERVTHRRYGLPSSVDQGMSLETLQEWFKKEYGAMARARGATIPDTMSWRDIVETANRLNGYEMTPDDRAPERGGVLTGQFLIDPDGIVRWTNLEEATMHGMGGFPSERELIAAARHLRVA